MFYNSLKRKIYRNNKNVKSKANKSKTYETNLPNYFKFPHISSKYFAPVIDLNDAINIPLYITDYDQKEYLYDISTEKFNVYYKVDNNDLKSIINVQAGDYILNIGKIQELGEHEITIYVKDKFGISSHVLYKKVLIVDKDEYEIKASETYNITQLDLDKYNIKNNDSNNTDDMNNTMLGLTALLEEIKNNGYRKGVLLNGIYRVPYNGRETPILIPSNFTLDMNGSTFKQNPPTQAEYLEDKSSLICQMKNCFDSHLINGVLDGDYVERLVVDDELGKNYITGNKGEGVWAFNFIGKCRYCTFENMQVNNITSYALSSKHDDPDEYHMTLNPSASEPKSWNENIGINLKTGINFNIKGVCTSDYYDISKYVEKDYMIFGVYLAGGGIIGGKSWKYIAYWYDADKKYIGYTNAHQYRKIKYNPDAKYVRISIIADSYTPSYYLDMIYFYDYNTNCAFKQISATNCRSCVFNPDYYKDLLIEDVEMTDCGQSITPAPIDFEDGWQNGQDAYLKNLNVLSGNNKIILCSGFNYVFENVKMGYSIRAGVYGTEISNSEISTNIQYASNGWCRNGYIRIHNCTFNDVTINLESSLNSNCPRTIKNSIFNNCVLGTAKGMSIKSSTLYNCSSYSLIDFIDCILDNFINTSTINTTFTKCTLTNSPANTKGGKYVDCILEGGTIDAYTSLIINSSTIKNIKIIKHSWYTCEKISITKCKITSNSNLMELVSIKETTNFNFSNNNINITNGSVIYMKHMFSGTYLIKNNNITLSNNFYILDYDHVAHLPDAETIINLTGNTIQNGNEVSKGIIDSAYVTIIK